VATTDGPPYATRYSGTVTYGATLSGMIEYRDAPDHVDLNQLAHLFESVGWHYRTRNPEMLAQMVRGSMYGASALDGNGFRMFLQCAACRSTPYGPTHRAM
jgi:hypothetical protein